MAKAKSEATKDWSGKLGTKEGEQLVYRIARQRENEMRDSGAAKFVRNSQGKLLIEGEEIKSRWAEYFKQLLNEENEREEQTEIEPVEGPIQPVTREEVEIALQKMKKGKAAGSSGLVVEMINALGEKGIEMVLDLVRSMWTEEKMPTDWEESIIVPVYKQKGDPTDCGNYRGIKLTEQLMKTTERILDQRLRNIIEINNMQFGFMPGRGTTEAMFIIQQMQEKYWEGQKDLFFCFVDLEKAYDRIPRDLVYRCLRKKKVPEHLIKLVKATYENARTRVRTAEGNTEEFNIKVGLHQGSALSPFLFIVVLDVIAEEWRGELPWEILFADDLALIAETEEELQEKWLKWQQGMARYGLKANTTKTEVLISSINKTKGSIRDKDGGILRQVEAFKYLGGMVSEDGGMELAVRTRIGLAWKKWRDLAGVMNDRKMPRRAKTRVYTTVIRPVMLYGAETWAVTKREMNKLEVAEMKMLRRILGVSMRDRWKNEDIRKELGVCKISEKIKEIRLRWYGHIVRAGEQNMGYSTLKRPIPGRRRRGRPKKRWIDGVQEDMRSKGLTDRMAQNRPQWRKRIRAADPGIAGTGD